VKALERLTQNETEKDTERDLGNERQRKREKREVFKQATVLQGRKEVRRKRTEHVKRVGVPATYAI